MRKIKFRLRRGNEIVGYEAWDGSDPSTKPSWVYSKDGKIGTFGSVSSWNSQPILHRQKDQYTGLKDKNGTEIYKGDILQIGEDGSIREIVEWKENMWTEEGFMTGYGEWFGTADQYKVIGNIHENPDLLG